MTFQTVEQMQAQIASLIAENERLTNENWRFQMGEAVMLKPHLGLISRLTAENERLRSLVEDAYYEGNNDAVYGYGRDWLGSDSAAALQPKEGWDE